MVSLLNNSFGHSRYYPVKDLKEIGIFGVVGSVWSCGYSSALCQPIGVSEFLIVRRYYTYSLGSEMPNHGKTRYIAWTVSNINHIFEWDTAIRLFYRGINHKRVPAQFGAKDSLVDCIDKLGFFGKGDGSFDSDGPASVVIVKLATKNVIG
jgi:hypothetical protein